MTQIAVTHRDVKETVYYMKEDVSEKNWDKLLRIRTSGRDDSNADMYRYPYEPTPYCVLERLANSGLI